MTEQQLIDRARLKEVIAGHIYKGNHAEASKEMCVMEAVAYVANEPWSDAPACVCPVIRSFLVSWNDSLPTDDDRDRLLKPLIEKAIGTRSNKETEERRSYMAIDWLIRVHTPRFLDLNDALKPHATLLRELDEIVDLAGATATGKLTRAAGAAAWDAARDAAGAAAWDAARDAAGAAARDAARAAARDAARAAAGAAARAAARDAARAAAGAAAWDAAWAAARDAAWDALKPTVKWLQISASDLVIRMCEVKC